MTDPADNTNELLSPGERETLLCAARAMIPGSDRHAVPGADDPVIFADILRSIERDRLALTTALQTIMGLAGRPLADLTENERTRVFSRFRAEFRELAGVLEATIARCYYRDDRVVASIGMEARPPYPLGYQVVQGDWSLLDPVRARGKMYRDTQ